MTAPNPNVATAPNAPNVVQQPTVAVAIPTDGNVYTVAPGPDGQPRVMQERPPAPPAVEMTDRFFGSLDGVIVAMVFALIAVLLSRLLQSYLVHRSLRKAIEQKNDIASELADKINRPFEPAGPSEIPGDDRNGLVLIAIGLAIAGAGLINGEEDIIRGSMGAALFPLFVGIALLVRRRLVLRAMEREQSAG